MDQQILDQIINALMAEKIRIEELIAINTPAFLALKEELEQMYKIKQRLDRELVIIADSIADLQKLGG